MITNFYLCAITFMQHTHPDVPHFDDDQWTWLRGALHDDRTMGPFADMKTHYIVPSHVVHHIFSDMPFYGAMEATPYVKAHLSKYYKSAMAKPILGSEYLDTGAISTGDEVVGVGRRRRLNSPGSIEGGRRGGGRGAGRWWWWVARSVWRLYSMRARERRVCEKRGGAHGQTPECCA